MRIHCIQHVPFETPGSILDWARERNHTVTHTRAWDGGLFPERSGYDLLLVMGGPMSVGDEREYPWLVSEKRSIGAAIAGDRIVLGICLGAQLIADVLGARVYRNTHREIGWFPVRRTSVGGRVPGFDAFPAECTPFHWHGDTFDLPAGSLHLAESEACVNQAFAYGGRVFGLQFHPEMTGDGVRSLLDQCSGDLVPGPYVQDSREIESGLVRLPALADLTRRFMEGLERGGNTD